MGKDFHEVGTLEYHLHAIERKPYASYLRQSLWNHKQRLEGCLAGCFLVEMLE